MLKSNCRQRSAQSANHTTVYHASHETLALYLLGDLSVRTAVSTREHLSSCRQCEERLPEIRAVIDALRMA